MLLFPGQIISNTYEIIERIGSGGMSLVYKAKHIKLNRFVTLKVMREEHLTDDEFMERFKIEARAIASLSHPNIVNVYDVGNDENINYIVMEYIDGLTLKELINKRAPFGNDEILGVAIQITDALMHAHSNGIVHRDIKPQNILVTKSGVIKVTDFGIARTVDSNTVSVGDSTMGSVHYFSPEQARGGFIDAKSDLYSLGIVMYEMATGELPFDGESAVAIALKQVNEPLPNIRKINPNISENVENVIIKLTDKKSFNRFTNDQELSDTLKAAIIKPNESIISSHSDRVDSKTIVFSGDEFEELKRETRRNSAIDDEEYYDEAGYENEERFDRKTEIKIIAAAIATAFVIITIAVLIILPKLGFSDPEKISMPNLVGMQFEEAYQQMEELGFTLEIAQELYDEEIPEGEIYDQNYNPGDPLYKDNVYEGDKAIKVNVSLGKELFEIPPVINIDIDEARQQLSDVGAGFKLTVEEINDPNTPKGIVIRQEPAENEKVEAGTEITLYVSIGKEIKQVDVPKLLGLTEAQARNKLKEYNLTIGTTTSEGFSDKYEKGQVMLQSVSSGRTVPEGTVVDIVLSKGLLPPQSEAPSPQPSPSAPTQTDQPVTGRTKNIKIPSDYFPEGEESVLVKVYKRVDGELNLIYKSDHSKEEFPLTVPVTGSGTEEISIFFNTAEIFGQSINFDESSSEQ